RRQTAVDRPGPRERGGGMTSDRPDEVSKEQLEFSRRRFLRYAGGTAVAGTAAGTLAALLDDQTASAASLANAHSDTAFFAKHPKYHFVMICHVTTNGFFTATQYGIADACAITGCSASWTGSQNSITNEMVSAFNSAIAGKANGIGCCLINDTAFNGPVDTALTKGIPVIAYNADVSAGVKNNRMAYVGQNNLTAGAAVGAEILKLGVGKGDLVAGIFAKAGVQFVEVGTSATEGAPEYNKISAWYAGHKNVKFMMAVDSGDSNAVAEFIQKNHLQGKVGASVWDVGLPVVQGINAGYVSATIDQQAYLQGFDTIMQLFLYNISGGLMKPTNTDTGLGIVTKANVKPYLVTNRFEGTNAKQKVLKPSAPIPH